MVLLNNFRRTDWPEMVEGNAQALLPSQWYGDRQFEKIIAMDGEVTVNKTAANPPGYYFPACINPPIKVGEMSMLSRGKSSFIGELFASKSMSVDLSGNGTLNGEMALAVSMLLALVGSGSMSAALLGSAAMSIDLEGSGDLQGTISGIAEMLLALEGSGDLEATIAAYGNMSIDISVTGTGLDTGNVGPAVWNALAAQLNNPGTMGALLNAAGDPNAPSLNANAVLADPVEGTINVRDALRRLLALVSGNGQFPAVGSFLMKSQDGTKDRITGTIDGAGNRTITGTDDT